MQNETTFTLVSLHDYLAFGVRYLSAYLKSHGHKVNIIFFRNIISTPSKKEEDLLIGLIRDLGTDLAGISVCSPYAQSAAHITRRIQQESGIPVIWGGIHPTIAPEQSLGIPDMLCVGEGEYATAELLQAISEGRDTSAIQGIWSRKNGQAVRNGCARLPQDLDTLPFPDYSNEGKYFIESDQLFEVDPALFEYDRTSSASRGSWRKGILTLKGEYYLLASRGCPFSCSYCCNSLLHGLFADQGKLVRWRSVGNVMQELRLIIGRFPRLKRIQFYDALFPWGRDWVSGFCQEYRRSVKKPFYIASHPTVLNREILVMLKDAGVEIVGFGIESASERVRKEVYERDVSDDSILKAANLLHELKISPHYYLILDNPFEGLPDRKRGLELFLSLPRPFILVIHALYLFPKVNVTRKVLSLLFGKITEQEMEEWLSRQERLGVDFTRPVSDAFWKSLFSLTAKSFVPRWLIRTLSNSAFLRRHPAPLVGLARLCNYLKFSWSAAVRLLKGEMSLKNIRGNVSLGQFSDIYH